MTFLAIFVAVFSVAFFIFLQLRRFQSRHGDAQQQKEKYVILPACFSAIDRRPGSLSPRASFGRRRWFLSRAAV
jgi:hypothetical protein